MQIHRHRLRRRALRRARPSWGSVISLLLAATACGESSDDVIGTEPIGPSATTEISLPVNAMARRYILHLPPVAASALQRGRRPLVLVLHGSSGVGETIRQQSGMDTLADAGHFLVAYPEGLGGANSDWNAGDCCGLAHAEGIDDVAFLRSVIADVASRVAVDGRRVYVAGFSDGGRMAYRAACEMSAEVAAVAAVSGSLETSGCAPPRKVPVIAFHGTNDQSVPYDDSAHATIPTPLPRNAWTLPPAVQFWLGTDQCRATWANFDVPRVVRTTGSGCAADLVFYSIEGGAHEWPDAARGSAMSASPVIVRFFLAHHLP